MSTATKKTRELVQLSLMAAIVVVVAFVPFLGYIPLVVIKATTTHIPVIIGAILMGPKAGGILGGVFGLTSIIKNTMEPALVSFAFSPLVPMPGSDSGSPLSLVVALVPRILIGVVAGLVFQAMAKGEQKTMPCAVAALAGSMTNTLLVMGSIYLFFGQQYAAANQKPFEALAGMILTIICTSGVAEAAVAAVLAVLVARPLLKVFPRG